MDVKEIRAINLRDVAENIAKSKAELANAAGTAPAYISQLLSPKHKAQVGDDLARRIEVAYNLDHGWMDTLHDKKEIGIAEQRAEYASLESRLTEEERGYINDLMRNIIEKREILKKLL